MHPKSAKRKVEISAPLDSRRKLAAGGRDSVPSTLVLSDHPETQEPISHRDKDWATNQQQDLRTNQKPNNQSVKVNV